MVKKKYFNLNTAVVLIAFVIAINWVWGSLSMMRRNYDLQKGLDEKSKQLIIAQLDVDNAKLAQKYYSTDEYKDLAVREMLGKVSPGESVIILPPNTRAAIDYDQASKTSTAKPTETKKPSNFSQWMNFLLGGNNSKLSSK